MKCKTCNSVIKEEWRKDPFTIKNKPLIYCSRKCSNNRGIMSEETKQKISKSLSGKSRNTKKTYIDFLCPVCGKVYQIQAGYPKKTCSKICKGYLLSIKRQKYLKENGNFCTKRETFNYKNITIEVDSNLEKAGIIYLIDNLKASRIERFENILNYWEGDAHRTFNPDFICNIDKKTCIVEIKQPWNKQSMHSYNRNIPLKYKALEKFCLHKNYNMLWLDFNTTPELKEIYKKILKER